MTVTVHLIVEIAVAIFAVFGFYCALRWVADLLFLPKQPALAIEIREKEDADMLNVLLHEAYSAFLHRRQVRIVVLISSALMNGVLGEGEELYDSYAALLERYGADCYLVDPF